MHGAEGYLQLLVQTVQLLLVLRQLLDLLPECLDLPRVGFCPLVLGQGLAPATADDIKQHFSFVHKAF